MTEEVLDVWSCVQDCLAHIDDQDESAGNLEDMCDRGIIYGVRSPSTIRPDLIADALHLSVSFRRKVEPQPEL